MANRIATAIRRIPEVDYTLADGGRRRRRHAEQRVDLREAARRSKRASAISSPSWPQVRDEILPPLTAEVAVRGVSVGGGGGGGGGGGVQFVLQGPDLERAAAIQRARSSRR